MISSTMLIWPFLFTRSNWKVTLLCRGSANSLHNASVATMGIIKVLDCFELEQDYERFLNLIPSFPKRLEVNSPVPSGLYKLTALLVKEEFINLESMHLSNHPTVYEIRYFQMMNRS